MTPPSDEYLVAPFDEWSTRMSGLIEAARSIERPEFVVGVRSDGSIWRFVEEGSRENVSGWTTWIPVFGASLVMLGFAPAKLWLRLALLALFLFAAGVIAWHEHRARRLHAEEKRERVFLAKRHSVGKLFRTVNDCPESSLKQDGLQEVFRLCKMHDALDLVSREILRRGVGRRGFGSDEDFSELSGLLDRAWEFLDGQADDLDELVKAEIVRQETLGVQK